MSLKYAQIMCFHMKSWMLALVHVQRACARRTCEHTHMRLHTYIHFLLDRRSHAWA